MADGEEPGARRRTAVVCGAGPAGSLMSIYLARAGFDVKARPRFRSPGACALHAPGGRQDEREPNPSVVE